MVTNDETFKIYSIGVCFASVCTKLEIVDAEAKLNEQAPTGISSSWKFANEDFKDGTPNGIPCPNKPMTHRHLLFSC